jgi:hypothetical protein
MKLSPMRKYKIVFYFMTFWCALPLLVTLLLAIVNPFWFRDDFLRWNERFAARLAKWRDQIPLVKYLDDKAHLFDKLRDSK